MMDKLTWNSEWQDPGATAVDAVDGDLSATIQSFGAGKKLAPDAAGCVVFKPLFCSLSCKWVSQLYGQLWVCSHCFQVLLIQVCPLSRARNLATS